MYFYLALFSNFFSKYYMSPQLSWSFPFLSKTLSLPIFFSWHQSISTSWCSTLGNKIFSISDLKFTSFIVSFFYPHYHHKGLVTSHLDGCFLILTIFSGIFSFYLFSMYSSYPFFLKNTLIISLSLVK